MKREKFKCETVECRKHNKTAMIVHRYKDHEYRYCPMCNEVYLTKKNDNGEIEVVNHWQKTKHYRINNF